MPTLDVSALIDQSPISRFQWRVFFLCALVVLLDGIDYQVIGIAAPLIVREFGVERGLLGWVFLAGPFGATVGGLTCGLIADRFGRQRTLIATTILFGLATVATTQAGGVVSLVILRFITGLGLGGAVPSFIALTSEYAPRRRRATIVSALWSAFPLGAMTGGFINAYLIQHSDWRVLFYLWGVAPLVVAAVLYLWLPESIRFLLPLGSASDRIHDLVAKLAGTRAVPGTTFVSSEPRVPGVPVKGLFTEGRAAGTIPLWIALFIVLGSMTVLAAWSPALLTPLGFTARETALVVAFNGLGSFIGTISAGRLIERFGVARCVIPTFILSAASVMAFGIAGSGTLWPIISASVVSGFFLGVGSSSGIALSALVYPTSIRSTGIGWAMSCGRFGAVVGPFFVGLMVSHGASVTEVFVAVAVALALAVPCLWQLAAYSRTTIADGGDTVPSSSSDRQPVTIMQKTT